MAHRSHLKGWGPCLLGLAVLAAAAPLAAQTPHVLNGRLEVQPAGTLDNGLRQILAATADATWMGYSEPLVPGQNLCCNGDMWVSGDVVLTNGRLAGCTLEPASGPQTSSTTANEAVALKNPVRLEGPESFFVFYRVENHAVEHVRMFSSDCDVDAGGRTIHWFTGVSPSDSINVLMTLVAHTEERRDPLSDGAIAAIAMHKAGEADAALERLGTLPSPDFVRRKAAFWMGVARGHRGFEAVQRMARTDPSDAVRKQAMFALSRSSDDAAIPELIRFAREDRSPAVRGEALFWLAQKAGQKAEAQITSSIENDPDTDVKKRAVFALSQLPKDQAVPLLIQVAKTNKNPAVRKQAMFWLGQSKDPRALEFFAQVLGG